MKRFIPVLIVVAVLAVCLSSLVFGQASSLPYQLQWGEAIQGGQVMGNDTYIVNKYDAAIASVSGSPAALTAHVASTGTAVHGLGTMATQPTTNYVASTAIRAEISAGLATVAGDLTSATTTANAHIASEAGVHGAAAGTRFLTASETLGIANGGTGQTASSAALTALGGAKLAGGNSIEGNQAFDTNTLYVDAVNNRVAIGSSTTNGALDVSAQTTVLNLYDNNSASTSAQCYLAFKDNTNALFGYVGDGSDASDDISVFAGSTHSSAYYGGGIRGLTLTTQGALLVASLSAGIPSGVEGTVIYNGTLHKLQFYNGSAWETVTSAP
jgi:hypothetical protein